MPNYTLRDYQQEAVDHAIKWMKSNSDPAVLELSGGAGKSIIIAEIARILFNLTGKRILCLVPSETLARQNGEKMELTGEKFSFFSASIQKSMRHKIVIATEGTFKSVASKYGVEFAAVLVDEADRVTKTFTQIIDDMREQNPLLRVLGLTGTPFRLMTGYIYELDIDNRQVQNAIEPYYKKLLYRVTCDELIERGYLTPIQVGTTSTHYDTSNLKIDTKNETFTTKSIGEMLSDGSVTERIIKDVVAKTHDKKGVMIFCTSIKHAEHVFSLLPENKALLLHGGVKDKKGIVKAFKSQQYKYLVNVDMATVGFDAPHVDCLVLLRPTASNRLFQQILWRGVRLYEDKEYCLLLDYTDNIPNLFGDDPRIFTPQIKAYGQREAVQIEVSCPECGTKQEHSKRQGYELYNEFGYAVDEFGDELESKIPSHYGRRCLGVVLKGRNQYERCSYWWAHKVCPECQEKNDIAAKNCSSCGIMLINPEDKLNDQAYVMKVGDTLTTNVLKMEIEPSSKGERVLVRFYTAHGSNVAVAFYPKTTNWPIRAMWTRFNKLTSNGAATPKQIRYTMNKKGVTINEYIM